MLDADLSLTPFIRPIMEVMAERLGGAVTLHAAPDGHIVSVAGTVPGLDVIDPIGAKPGDYADRFQVFAQDGSAAKVKDLPVVRSLASGEIITDELWLLSGVDGLVPVFVDAYPLKDNSGMVVGVLATATDPQRWNSRSDRLKQSIAIRDRFVRR